jgi:hypothetical protein
MGSRIIFNIALGPKHVLMTSATVCSCQLGSWIYENVAYLSSNDIGGLSFPSRLTLRPNIYLSASALPFSHFIAYS